MFERGHRPYRRGTTDHAGIPFCITGSQDGNTVPAFARDAVVVDYSIQWRHSVQGEGFGIPAKGVAPGESPGEERSASLFGIPPKGLFDNVIQLHASTTDLLERDDTRPDRRAAG